MAKGYGPRNMTWATSGLGPTAVSVLGWGVRLRQQHGLPSQVLLDMGGLTERWAREVGRSGVPTWPRSARPCLSGHRLAYEPRLIGWHDHRANEEALRQQTFGYAVGLTAVLTKWVITRPPCPPLSVAREAMRVLTGLPASRPSGPRHREVSQLTVQLRMNRDRVVLAGQLGGFALGPILSAAQRRRARRLGLYGALPPRAHERGEDSMIRGRRGTHSRRRRRPTVERDRRVTPDVDAVALARPAAVTASGRPDRRRRRRWYLALDRLLLRGHGVSPMPPERRSRSGRS